MIKGFIFDLDGTLLDRDSSLKSFIVDQYERISALQIMDKDVFVYKFIELDKRGYVWKDKVYQQIIQEFNLSLAWEELLADYINGFQRHCIGFPNLLETLQYLKKNHMKLGMITNGFGEFQTNNIKALGIADIFDTILVSEIEGLRKPDPEIFKRALHKLGLKPEEGVYVGDHPVNDVLASRRIGMKGIWKEDLYYDGIFERDYTIRDLYELKTFLEINL
jgi:putative hydrolase of the HAD superfamily